MGFFSSLPEHSRVWVYTSNKEFTPEEVTEIKNIGNEFVDAWKVHGKNLDAGFEVIYNRFIVLAVDENVAGASGCSIDSSVGLMKKMESQFNVTLLDKLNLAFHGPNNTIVTLPMHEFQKELESGGIHSETIVFNNLIENVKELRSLWEVPLKNSWHKQLL